MIIYRRLTTLSIVCGLLLCGAPPALDAADLTGTTVGQVAASAAEAMPLLVGSSIPNVTLETVDKAPFTLREAVAKQPTVLIFYRGGWCPFCNAHLSQMQGIAEELKGVGYQILAVTPDLPENVAETVAKDHLTYTLLSDPRGEAMKGFGVAFRLDDATFNRYKNDHKLDLEKRAGNDAHLLPVPSVFVLDTKGTVRFVHSDPDYKVRLSAADVLMAARAATAQTGAPGVRRVAIEYRDLTGTQPVSSAPWVAHSAKFRLWEEGRSASLPVQELAENGNPEFLLGAAIFDDTGVFGDAAVGLPNAPGKGRRVELGVDAAHPLVSGGWMLGFTNDGFAGVTSVNAYALTAPLTLEVYALDAGTEKNTEAKADAAALGGLGRVPENGVVARHPGLRGDADIPASYKFDASKPAGRVTITPLP